MHVRMNRDLLCVHACDTIHFSRASHKSKPSCNVISEQQNEPEAKMKIIRAS